MKIKKTNKLDLDVFRLHLIIKHRKQRLPIVIDLVLNAYKEIKKFKFKLYFILFKTKYQF